MFGRTPRWAVLKTGVVTASALLAVFIILVLLSPSETRAATTIDTTTFPNTGDVYWTRLASPYVVTVPVSKRFGSFSIEPGVVVKFMPGATLSTHADVVTTIVGTETEPIYFTSYKDDSVGGDTNGDGAVSTPAPGDWGSTSFGGGSTNNNMSLGYLKVRYGGSTSENTQQGVKRYALAISYPWFSGSPGRGYTLQHIEVSHSLGIGLYVSVGQGNSLSVTQSSFHDNTAHGLYRRYTTNLSGFLVSGPVSATDNWWGDASGPFHQSLNPTGLGDPVDPTTLHVNLGGSVSFTPWLTTDPIPDPVPEPTCCSSVLFLPGIMGSRLYANGEKLWESLDGDADILALYLDAAGDSTNPDIYTQDVIGTAPITNGDIYQPLLNDLADIKATGSIQNYIALPYDWRLALPDLLAGGREAPVDHTVFYSHATSTPYIEQTLRQLAASSKTGKVTIVAHSNGGLLAKALLNGLEEDASRLVDKLILVAVPQSGTPQAIGSLLHGFDTGLPFDWFSPILSPERAREFARNAPFAYHLLPHSDYLYGAGATITTPLVTFEHGLGTQVFIDEYGASIDSADELYRFIRGEEGRVPAAYADLKNPSVTNSALLSQVISYVDGIDSSWVAPAGIEVHQIAGVGEETLAGITYKSGKVRCVRWVSLTSSTPWCAEYATGVLYTPDEVIDGDGTVVTPSALAMSDSNQDVKRWWLNLDLYNDTLVRNLIEILRTQHGNIFEVPDLRTFIFENLLSQSETELPEFVSGTKPNLSKGNRLRFVLHSPLSLSVTDNLGNEVSEETESIPGSSYVRYGEVQVVWVPASANPIVKLEGEAEGIFTLEVDEFVNSTHIESIEFSGIPTTQETVATMEFLDGTIANAGDLIVDYNGDNTIDQTFTAVEGETVTVPKIPLTVTATSKVITLGQRIPILSYTISGFLAGESLASSDITGEAVCETAATAISPAGQYRITCTLGTLASEYYSFDTPSPATLSIQYKWSGFTQPIDDPVATPGISASIFKAGSTVPVKFMLKDTAGASIQATSLPLWIQPVREGSLTGSVDEPVYSDAATTGTLFRWDEAAKQYMYNWKTKGLTPGYWYRISTQLDDGTTRSVRVGLK